MGATGASLPLLADAVSYAQSFISVFVYVYVLLILSYVVLTFFRVPYSLTWLQRFLYDVCEPYLRIFRRLLPSFGPLDLSPFVGTAVLVLIERLLVGVVLDRLH